MLWITWRQFRAQTIVAVAALAVSAVTLTLSGLHIARLYTASISGCRARGNCGIAGQNFLTEVNASLGSHLPLLFGTALVAVPAIIGIFWGAPLLSRELESGTHRLAWNQGFTRTRWLVVNLAVIGAASMAAAGLFSLMVTWSASRIDAVSMNWLQPATFSERGIVPVGYAAFAFTLGVTAGMLIRRSVPAMAVTLAVFTAAQFAMRAIRQYLIPPAHLTSAITGLAGVGIRVTPGGTVQLSVTPAANIPGAWILGGQTVNAAGQTADRIALPATGPLSIQSCGPGQASPQACLAELAKAGYRQLLTFQPASRFWAFQWYETAIFGCLAVALAAFCIRRIRRTS